MAAPGARPKAAAGAGGGVGSGGGGGGTGSGTPVAALTLPASPSVSRPFAYAFSAETAKVIHLVRHGQGYHNVEAAVRSIALPPRVPYLTSSCTLNSPHPKPTPRSC